MLLGKLPWRDDVLKKKFLPKKSAEAVLLSSGWKYINYEKTSTVKGRKCRLLYKIISDPIILENHVHLFEYLFKIDYNPASTYKKYKYIKIITLDLSDESVRPYAKGNFCVDSTKPFSVENSQIIKWEETLDVSSL